MDTEKIKKQLIRQAMERNKGKNILFCGNKTAWNDCFTEEEFNNKKQIIFWYNLENGHTLSEIAILNT